MFGLVIGYQSFTFFITELPSLASNILGAASISLSEKILTPLIFAFLNGVFIKSRYKTVSFKLCMFSVRPLKLSFYTINRIALETNIVFSITINCIMLIVLPWANVHFSDTFQPQACIALYVTKGVEGV